MRHPVLKSIVAILSGFALIPACLAGDASTTTPIKHVIVVIGENNTFDTIFGTYTPPRGQSAFNLLSQGIVKADGSPGENYGKAVQSHVINATSQYTLNPIRMGALASLPQPTLIGVYNPSTLTLYGTSPDPRFNGLAANGPFQISKYVPYGTASSAVGDPVHRFFQMWQQTGGTNDKHDLFQWVATTVGQGGATDGVTSASSGQGGELMGFYNMNQGDAPLFKALAQQYAISDNYHQAVMGGTGANFFALATAGDAPVYNNNGVLAIPPVNQIESPTPQAGTDNFYSNDGYSGGSYVNCSDSSQPGVAEIMSVLHAKGRNSNCESGAYYLVNNYTPAYDVYGNLTAPTATNFVYPPQTVPTIGELLSNKGVSWKWYTGGREDADVTGDAFYQLVYPQVLAAYRAYFPAGTPDAVIAPYATPAAIKTTRSLIYNSIGDPLNTSSNIVTSALRNNLQGLTTLYNDISNNSVPAVSFVVPKNLYSGHPGYSAPGNYELFIQDLIQKVQANPALWANTAILITTDEGGGYFDTGAIQNLDFFGDGPRIPLIVVSPYAKKGHVDHVYHDHVSIAKFIEKNWSLPTLSNRSRDNLPNPVKSERNPYLPANQPAIGDLTSLFNFDH